MLYNYVFIQQMQTLPLKPACIINLQTSNHMINKLQSHHIREDYPIFNIEQLIQSHVFFSQKSTLI